MGTKDQWLRAIHPDASNGSWPRTIARRGEPFRCEYRLLAKDGHPVWMRDEAAAQDEHGEGRYWRGVRFDITTEKPRRNG
jgi:PAS domain-containing protein